MKKLLHFAHFQSCRLLKKEKLKLTLTNFNRLYASHVLRKKTLLDNEWSYFFPQSDARPD